MTGEHRSGSDRCWEVAKGFNCDVVVNIQGDEPMIQPPMINQVLDPVYITTLKHRISYEDAIDVNVVKVVGNGLYFSREPIPSGGPYWGQVGIYSFPKDDLRTYTSLEQSSLEKSENLEQLRWIENGGKIDVLEVDYHGKGVDTPKDLDFVVEKMTGYYYG